MLHASDSFPSHWVLLLEAALVIAGLAAGAAGWRPLAASGGAAMRALGAAGRRPAVSLLALALATALFLALHTAIAGAPLPRVVDEWSYLLASDTFAHNRLANPAHPMGLHFEADHVLQRPTYASKYPPAQGFVLAIGQVACGHPVAGLWLAAALLVAASGWMLLGWVPARWAILGAVLVALRLGAGSYWSQSYWGGTVAAIGGALVIGAARRLFRTVRAREAAALAAGLALLATSRPYEGLLASLPAAALLVCGLAAGRLRPQPWRRLVLPVAFLLAATIAGITALNRSVTGDPLVFPHSLYDRTHGVEPVFLWQPRDERARAPGRGSSESAETARLGPPAEERPPAGRWREPRSSGWHRASVTLHFFLGLPGALPIFLTPVLLRQRWTWFAAATFLAVAAGHFLIYPWWPHYSAPALGALLVLAVQGQRRLYALRRSSTRDARACGQALFGAACAIQLIVFAAQVPAHRADLTDPSRQRARLAWEFEHRAGDHLLLVAYPPGRGNDWTYNSADIDGAKVVWANDLGDSANAELLRYYPARTVWRIEAPFTAADPVPRLLRPAID